MVITGSIDTSVKISDFDFKYCDASCQYLNGMKDKCGICGRLQYVSAHKLFVRGDKCVSCFNVENVTNG